jgi:hypothetical protein
MSSRINAGTLLVSLHIKSRCTASSCARQWLPSEYAFYNGQPEVFAHFVPPTSVFMSPLAAPQFHQASELVSMPVLSPSPAFCLGFAIFPLDNARKRRFSR